MEKKSSPKQASDKQAVSSQSKSTSKPAVNAKKSKADVAGSSNQSRSETGKKS